MDRQKRTRREQAVTWVGWEERAALAVDDLLHSRHVWRDGRGHDPQARHHGVDGRDSSHHPKSRVEIWVGERRRRSEEGGDTLFSHMHQGKLAE